ncbi:MAG: FadR family transcriptional regulator [Clostridia bacterium]|nr:FadR family transcriptional regulator [Clostridia bacterium]
MEVQKIYKKKIPQEVAEQIINLISNGDLAPGEKLPSEKELEEMFGVSRPSIREALSALEMAEIIEMRHGEGSFVREIDINNHIHPLALKMLIKSGTVYEILDARKAIECHGAYLAALNAETQELSQIQEILNDMRNEINQGKIGEDIDLKFHLAISKASHNSILYQIMENMSELIKHCQKHTRQYSRWIPGRPEEIYHQHVLIFQAISSKRAQEAYQRMKDHLDDIISTCQKFEKQGEENRRRW